MQLEEFKELQEYTTMRVQAQARYFMDIQSEQDLFVCVTDPLLREYPVFVLGGGSNVLFVHDYAGVVVHMNIKGIEVVAESATMITLKVAAGEKWNDLVEYAISHDWGGIENLIMIPGTVGAAPVQNIAAYGQNISDVFVSLEAYEIGTGAIKVFDASMCQFGYRDSIFKHALRNQYIISSVTIKLAKHPELNTGYFSQMRHNDSVLKELSSLATEPYTVKDVSLAVSHIRARKLPDVTTTPSVGSFFLNPVVTKKKLASLQERIPDLQYYPVDNLSYEELHSPTFDHTTHVKVAAGQLLDVRGWAGKVVGNCSMHGNHALVVTHNGNATGEELYEFIQLVQQDCLDAYGIELETEVTILT